MRALSMPLALLGLLWLALTCAHLPAGDAPALGATSELLASACQRALARLAPDAEPARRLPVALPAEWSPALRALHGTGMAGRVAALEAALDRAARMALAQEGPWLEEAVGRFTPEEPDAALAAAFRGATEADLRSRLAPAVERELGPAGAVAALAAVQDGASRLPLRRRVEGDLVALVTDQAVDGFFTALAEEERSLREERESVRGG